MASTVIMKDSDGNLLVIERCGRRLWVDCPINFLHLGRGKAGELARVLSHFAETGDLPETEAQTEGAQ